MSDPITILIVDDHAVVRRGARAFLEAQPDFAVVGDVGSGGEAVLLAADLAPDVVLMDLVMPGMDGHICPAIRAGALSYLLKDNGLPELADAIRKAARGEVVMHPHIAARVVQELDGASHRDMASFAQLSEREREVLHLIAEGLSNATIAEQLVLSEKTVKSHVRNILGKLHLVDRTQAAIFAWRQGLMGS